MLWTEQERDLRLLVADNVALSRRAAELALSGLNQPPLILDSEEAVAAALRDRHQLWDVLVIDRRLFGDQTIEALKLLEKEKRKPRVVVLGQLTDSARERSSLGGVDVYLLKPLRRLQLRNGVRQAMTPAAATIQEPVVKTNAHGEAMPHLLIVEDNEVNARLAILHLEKLGFAHEVARDGAEAVQRFRSGVYDGILMDCHMPIMDGYDATRSIREIESQPGWNRPRVRIIAMTANAMAGERERCLEAGMDDYLPKPLRAATLMQALSQVQHLRVEEDGEITFAEQDQSEAIAAIQQLAEELSEEAAVQLIENWLKDTPERLEEISQLAGDADQSKLKRVAHSLKGSSSLFGLTSIKNLCRDMEQLAEKNITTGQPLLASALQQAFADIEPVLRAELTRLQQLS